MSFRRLGALVCASLILAVVCHIPASARRSRQTAFRHVTRTTAV